MTVLAFILLALFFIACSGEDVGANLAIIGLFVIVPALLISGVVALVIW